MRTTLTLIRNPLRVATAQDFIDLGAGVHKTDWLHVVADYRDGGLAIRDMDGLPLALPEAAMTLVRKYCIRYEATR